MVTLLLALGSGIVVRRYYSVRACCEKVVEREGVL